MSATQLRRITEIIRRSMQKSMQRIRIFKSTRAKRTRFTPRAPVRSRYMVYSGWTTIAFGTSYMLSNRNAMCAANVHPHDNKSFDLFNTIRALAPQIDAQLMLRKTKEVCNKEEVITQEFLIELFQQCGVDDARIARELFRILDWNADGNIRPDEMACIFTLFQTGTAVDRYRFLFQCIDLEDSKTVNKAQFRAFYATMLEMKYRLTGIKGEREPYEWYFEIYEGDYKSIAKLRANLMVRQIFLWADQHRKGELNQQEFLHWCKRGGPQVSTLEETLSSVCQEGLGIHPPRNVFKYDL